MSSSVTGMPAKSNHRAIVGQRRRAATESRILQAAIKVFAELGADVPVIDDFIRESGVSRGTFYNYFKSTRELLDATIETILTAANSHIEQALAGLDGPAERMAGALVLYLSLAAADRDFARFMSKIPYAGVSARRSLETDLEHGREAGDFNFRSREIADDLVLGTMQQSFRRVIDHKPAAGWAEEVAAAILRGLGASEQRIIETYAKLSLHRAGV